MRAAVVGAAGTIGPAIARDLATSDEVAGLLLLDLDEARAREVAASLPGAEVSASRADAGDPGSLARALAGCDVVVNSASYRLNLAVMQASLDAGAHYLDLGGLYRVTREQFEAFAPARGEDRFASAGLLAVLGIGSSPGKTNLMAVRAARELGATAPGLPGREPEDAPGIDSLHVSAAGRDLDPPPGFSVPYALRTLIDELTLAPVVIRDGEPVEIEPLSDGGTIDFGDPIGSSETIHTLHSEMLTFPPSFGCREGSFRLSLHPELLERLRGLASASDAEVAEAAASAAPPSANTVSVHAVDATRGGRSVRVRSVTRPVEGLGVGGSVASTAAPAAAAVRLLARGLESRGVHPPERCIEPEEMFAELESRGSEFELSVGEEVAVRG